MKKTSKPSITSHQRWMHDIQCMNEYAGIVGVDEAGRGCFAGPVVACAVFLRKSFFQIPHIQNACIDFNDSKQIPPLQRSKLMSLLQTWKEEGKIHYYWNQASSLEIDQYNILGATKLAMQRALDQLTSFPHPPFSIPPLLDKLNAAPLNSTNTPFPSTDFSFKSKLIIDGRPLKHFPYEHAGIIQGDSHSLVIAMASIIAKVQRDLIMEQLDTAYPQYGFKSHKGYGTPQHRTAIQQHGLCSHHRRSFIHFLNSTPSPLTTQQNLSFETATVDSTP